MHIHDWLFCKQMPIIQVPVYSIATNSVIFASVFQS